jgi:hypothetical protein
MLRTLGGVISAILGGGVSGWLVPSGGGGGLVVVPELLNGATASLDRHAETLT